MRKNFLNDSIINNPMVYRDKLTIPSKVNFEIEIELEDTDKEKTFYLINKYIGSEWVIQNDSSLSHGFEIASPILCNNKKTWILLKKLGLLLESLKPTFDNSSFQVSFDRNLLKNKENEIRFAKLFAVYEDIIYRFSKGEDELFRSSLDTYAAPTILCAKDSNHFAKHHDFNDYIVEKMENQKRYGYAFKTKRTANIHNDLIEFRSANSTTNTLLWQNYITTFYYLLMYATNSKCNEKELDEYIDKFNNISLLNYYEKLKTEKALEFADKIFSKRLDKIYFMEQYLGKDKIL